MVDIATIEEVRGWVLGDTNDDSQDAILEPLRKSTDEIIKDYCDCLFGETDAVVGEVLDGRRTDMIVPDHFPIQSVQKVVMGADGSGSGGYELEASDYNYRQEEIVLIGTRSVRRRGTIILDYTHGYPNVPERVKQALLLAVEAMYNRKARRSIGVSSRSKEGETESYGGGSKSQWNDATGLPNDVMGMLQEYKRIEFTGSVMHARNS